MSQLERALRKSLADSEGRLRDSDDSITAPPIRHSAFVSAWDFSETTEKVVPTAAPVQLDEVVAADNVAWVVRNGDDEVEDDVVGHHVEEVLAVDQSRQAALDDPDRRFEAG